MQRIVKFFKEWYTSPGGLLLMLPVVLFFALAVVSALGSVTLDRLVY